MSVLATDGAHALPSRGASRWRQVDVPGSVALVSIHALCLAAPFTGVSAAALVAAALVYWTQIFGVSAGYHRYFAHRTFRTSRAFQFVLAWLGATSAQMGPLWWASFHRRHHQHSDEPEDVHSPRQHGFLWSHVGWVLDRRNATADERYVRDWIRYPELRFIDRFRWLPPLSLILALLGVGTLLRTLAPGLGTGPLQLTLWGYFAATTLCYQVTFCVNSITHLYGRRPYETTDGSRNVWWLALLTNGEGWHNNHHRFPSSERHGIRWWELDVTHYILVGLSKLGVVWGIRAHRGTNR